MNLNKLQQKLKENDYTLIADIDGKEYVSNQRGIAPVLNPMKEQMDFFKGAIVIDKVIGKATAMLLVLSGVHYIYAYVISQKAKDILNQYQIHYDYEKCVDYIENRDHTGMCPMEQTVYEIDDLEQALFVLVNKQNELKNGNMK